MWGMKLNKKLNKKFFLRSFLSVKTGLTLFCLCSSTFAVGGETFAMQEQPVVSQFSISSVQQPSESFLSLLTKRFSEVFGEVKTLLNQSGNVLSLPVSTVSEQPVMVHSSAPLFTDIDEDPYAGYISILANKGIVKWVNTKYYPLNYVRFGEFVKVVVDSYRIQVWYDISTNQWLVKVNLISSGSSLSPYLNTAYSLWFLEWIDKGKSWYDINAFLTRKQVNMILSNIQKQLPEMIVVVPSSTSDLYVKKNELAKYIVDWFNLQVSDISSTDLPSPEPVSISVNQPQDSLISRLGVLLSLR